MYFVVFGTDKPNMTEVRKQNRPDHRAYLRNPSGHQIKVVLAGPTLDSDGCAMNGTLLVVEAGSLDEVVQFMNDDPYVRANLFANTVIRPWTCGLGSIAPAVS